MIGTSEMEIADDVIKIGRISIIPVILEAVCDVTGMGFAAVARVTPERWVACQVLDKIKFGLRPGGELKVDTTICHEIRQSGDGVVIDHVAEDEFFARHHTPAMYGFQSYISVPVTRNDSSFWGTLCAIDPNPALLNTPSIIGMFKTYAALISFHLTALEQLPAAEVKELEQRTTTELKRQLESLGIAHTTATRHNKHTAEYTDVLLQSTNRIKQLLVELKG